MDDKENFVGQFIAHYASEYYNPAKAREYYLKNRELKGRKTGLKTDAERQGWDYAKSTIEDAKKKELVVNVEKNCKPH